MELQNSKSERSKLIAELISSRDARESYIRATLNTLIPSQLKALRLREEMTQQEVGTATDMKQARISAAEKPGAVSFSLETLIRFAAAYKVGLLVKFVPHSTMLDWENRYSQDHFKPVRLPEDRRFLEPNSSSGELIPDFDYSRGYQEVAGEGEDEGGNLISPPTRLFAKQESGFGFQLKEEM